MTKTIKHVDATTREFSPMPEKTKGNEAAWEQWFYETADNMVLILSELTENLGASPNEMAQLLQYMSGRICGQLVERIRLRDGEEIAERVRVGLVKTYENGVAGGYHDAHDDEPQETMQ